MFWKLIILSDTIILNIFVFYSSRWLVFIAPLLRIVLVRDKLNFILIGGNKFIKIRRYSYISKLRTNENITNK